MRVHDSQVYKKMDVSRECINRILELREILSSFETGFSLVNAAVVCVILESISGLEPSSVITEPRYWKLVTVSSFCPSTLISVLMPLVLFVISRVFSALGIIVSVSDKYNSQCHRFVHLRVCTSRLNRTAQCTELYTSHQFCRH